MNNLTKWDRFGLTSAALWASMSKDPSTKVGAYIADWRHRPVSGGYNGFPRGVEDFQHRLDDRAEKYPRTIHAELNAILNARGEIPQFSTLYVHGLPCCGPCCGAAIQAGLSRIVMAYPKNERAFVWNAEHGEVVRSMCAESGVILQSVELV
ncbi:dCMP deaminase [Achromobacter phage nyashin_LB6]|nr:dCMP deaminase [Achromobacter phage nyashin_LB6]